MRPKRSYRLTRPLFRGKARLPEALELFEGQVRRPIREAFQRLLPDDFIECAMNCLRRRSGPEDLARLSDAIEIEVE